MTTDSIGFSFSFVGDFRVQGAGFGALSGFRRGLFCQKLKPCYKGNA